MLFCLITPLLGLSLLAGTSLADQPNKGTIVSTDLKIRVVDSFALMRETDEGREIAQALQEKGKKYAETIQAEQKQLYRYLHRLWPRLAQRSSSVAVPYGFLSAQFDQA